MVSENQVTMPGMQGIVRRELTIAQKLQRAYDTSGGAQITPKTVELSECCDEFFEVLQINGPAELVVGNGTVYSITLVDLNNVIETLWCGSEQVKKQIEADPSLQDAVNNGFVRMCIRFTNHPRTRNGQDMHYFTSVAWFGEPNDTVPLLGKFY